MDTQVNQELCLSCAAVNPAGTDFCRQCGAPLTSRATTDPYLSIFAEGFAIRQATARPNKPIILIGTWLLSTSALAGAIVSLVSGGGILGMAVDLGVLILWGAVAYKVTRNYLRLRHARRNGS